ncbi:alpha/beta hydrolase family esterase [Halobacteriales archaeon Cl-PHB]
MSERRNLRRRDVLVSGAVLGGTILAGCVGGDGGKSASPTETATTTEAATDTPAATATPAKFPGHWTTETTGDGQEYRLYVPASHDGGDLALLVALHGCDQSPEDFADLTQLNEKAERATFAVAYPRQTQSRNYALCWNWFSNDHTTRGNGEAAAIAGVVDHVGESIPVASGQVYLTGLSAGAAMVPNLLVAYPDVFDAGAVHSGLEYNAATNTGEAQATMKNGGPDPVGQGTAAYETMGDRAQVLPTVVVHGTADEQVRPVNGEQAAHQAVQTNDLAVDGVDDDSVDFEPEATTDVSASGASATRRSYHTPDGDPVVEYVSVEGMSHGWAGGAEGEKYAAPEAPSANDLIWDFFQRAP